MTRWSQLDRRSQLNDDDSTQRGRRVNTRPQESRQRSHSRTTAGQCSSTSTLRFTGVREVHLETAATVKRS